MKQVSILELIEMELQHFGRIVFFGGAVSSFEGDGGGLWGELNLGPRGDILLS